MLISKGFLEKCGCQRIFASEHANGKNWEARAPYQVMRGHNTLSTNWVRYSTIVQFFRAFL
jgi:hypothetical protein